MALRKVRSNLDRLFDKSLTDLIRGIRNNKENEVRSSEVDYIFVPYLFPFLPRSCIPSRFSPASMQIRLR
ncbi:unnamed protein product [Heligmosomoides polygyrus]|uniref:BHLH domain-containing protein n=1 Tax=Heligmosomoides polygyrus TaxID=6339 RepID=A0A183F742_HELPZ|nr:unnamed protein product [Heligmosomoides polygyrus]